MERLMSRWSEEQVQAAAEELARLDLPDSHTLDDRIRAVERWRRYEYQARRVLDAVAELEPDEWEYGRSVPRGQFTVPEDWFKTRDDLHPADWPVRVRRRKAGPWEPVEGEGS